MKSYDHLWRKFISDENIELAIKKAAKGKRERPSVKRWLDRPNLKEEIRAYACNFQNYNHKPKQIYDGIQRKKRTIIVPNFKEQIVHHMIVNVLQPIFMHGMYEHSYGSIPKRGCHKGKNAIAKWIKHDSRNCKYVLKMDIRKYFESIPHDIYLENLRKLIHDQRFMAVLEEITKATEKGLPLGYYTSQWTANWYLQGLDHYIKEDLGARHYIRYMDDMVIFGGNKRKLHRIKDFIEEYLKDRLGLELKGNWQVFRFDYQDKYRFLDFMGFRFYRNRVTLRKTIMLKASRKAKRIYEKVKINVHSARQMLSYLGWIAHTDTYNFYSEWIKPIVNFQMLKRKIRNHDKNMQRRLSYELVSC